MKSHDHTNKIHLCSQSKRRFDILTALGINVQVCSVDIDESPISNELPKHLVLRLAKMKMDQCLKTFPLHHEYVLTADTIVGVGRRVLPKPKDKKDAIQHLTLLSGRRHMVYGGICFYANQHVHLRLVKTAVLMKRLTLPQIHTYLDTTSSWMDACGSYAIQGYAGMFVRKIMGSYTNVVGCDAYTIGQLCEGTGFWQPSSNP